MTRTLSLEIERAIKVAKNPMVKKWSTPEEIQLWLGRWLLEAAGVENGKKEEGCTPNGEPITRRGRKTLAVRMVDFATEAVTVIGPSDPEFLRKRDQIAKVLGRSLLE